MPSTSTHPLTIIRHTAARIRAGGWLYDAANLDLAVKALERPGEMSHHARAVRLFGSEWLRHEAEAAE